MTTKSHVSTSTFPNMCSGSGERPARVTYKGDDGARLPISRALCPNCGRWISDSVKKMKRHKDLRERRGVRKRLYAAWQALIR